MAETERSGWRKFGGRMLQDAEGHGGRGGVLRFLVEQPYKAPPGTLNNL